MNVGLFTIVVTTYHTFSSKGKENSKLHFLEKCKNLHKWRLKKFSFNTMEGFTDNLIFSAFFFPFHFTSKVRLGECKQTFLGFVAEHMIGTTMNQRSSIIQELAHLALVSNGCFNVH